MLALALLVVVAAPVGGVPGTTQSVWHSACCELQVSMQLVVVDVCANRSPLCFGAANAAVTNPKVVRMAKAMVKPRTPASHFLTLHTNAKPAATEMHPWPRSAARNTV